MTTDKLDLDALERFVNPFPDSHCVAMRAGEVREIVRRIRSLEAAPQPVGAPVAWMHVMDNTDGIKGNKPWVVFTASKKNPFGKPGIDYSKSYPVTSTPLYAAPPCSLSNGGEGDGE